MCVPMFIVADVDYTSEPSTSRMCVPMFIVADVDYTSEPSTSRMCVPMFIVADVDYTSDPPTSHICAPKKKRTFVHHLTFLEEIQVHCMFFICYFREPRKLKIQARKIILIFLPFNHNKY